MRVSALFLLGSAAFLHVIAQDRSGDFVRTISAVRADHIEEYEIVRIREHLAGAEALLLGADVSALSAAQRSARARHIEVLRAYREAGVFPHNHVVAERRVPVFVDEHGTHCAVGWLLAQDGRHDIVARISATRNLATVHELADDGELAAWLEEAGISVAEAARIQPMYGPLPAPEEPPAQSRAYSVASILSAGANGGAIAWNIAGGGEQTRGLRGGAAVGTGVAGLALAGMGLYVDGSDRDIDAAHIALNAGLGVIATVIGLHTLTAGDAREQAAADAETVGSLMREQPQWRLSAWSPGKGGGAGVRLNVIF